MSLRTGIIFFVMTVAFAAGTYVALSISSPAYADVDIGGIPLRAEVVERMGEKARGLSGRGGLPEGGAMLFVFEEGEYPAIWMKDMHFPIDIIWISKGRVVHVEGRAPVPLSGTDDNDLPIYRTPEPAEYVLETQAGFAAAHGVSPGKPVMIRRNGIASEPSAPHSSAGPAAKPGREFFIDAIRGSEPRGRNFRIGDMLERHDSYQKFAITYASGDLTISGVMNMPQSPPPTAGFPVLILNHGLIPADIYESGRGSRREQDFFARHGYITIHPDYRGLGSSTPNPANHHDFYAGYAEDVMNLVDAIRKEKPEGMDTERIGMWGHSMGGGIAARIMVTRPEIRAFVLFAPISADAEENFYELSAGEVEWLYETYGESGSETFRNISPIEYMEYVTAPVQIHHGTADKDVPIEFSERLFAALQSQNKYAQLHRHEGQRHEFIEQWPLAIQRALDFFDRHVKNAD